MPIDAGAGKWARERERVNDDYGITGKLYLHHHRLGNTSIEMENAYVIFLLPSQCTASFGRYPITEKKDENIKFDFNIVL